MEKRAARDKKKKALASFQLTAFATSSGVCRGKKIKGRHRSDGVARWSDTSGEGESCVVEKKRRAQEQIYLI